MVSEQDIPPRQAALAYASGSVTVLIWGLTPAATVFAVSEIDGVAVGMLRVILAGLLVLPIAILMRLPRPDNARDWGLLMLSAVTNMTGFSVFFSLSLMYTSTLHVALIQASIPIYAGLFSAAVNKRLPSSRWWLGVAIAFIGLVVLFVSRDASGREASLFGDFLCFLAALCSGVGHVTGGRVSARIGTWGASLWSIAFAGITLIPFFWLVKDGTDWAAVSHQGWSAIAYLVVFSSTLSFLFWYRGIVLGGIARIVPLQFVQPIVTMGIGVWLFSEVMTPALILATLAVMGGIFLTRRA